MSPRLQKLTEKKRKLLVPFITAGFLEADQTLDLMHGLVKNGADVIELGVPFSDPVADGEVIQRASERALEKGTKLTDIFDLVDAFRKTDKETPIVLMGYANPVENYGWPEFLEKVGSVGVDGLLIVDYPPEIMDRWQADFVKNQVSSIFLVAPTTTRQRMEMIASKASGFLYFISLKGVTGSDTIDYESISNHISFLRQKTNLPIVAGFGIKDCQIASKIASYADGIVIGSKIIEMIEASPNHADTTQALAWFKTIREALDKE